jgi:hypothetical protein
VAGAHGGHCTTWLACIRDDETEAYLEDILDKINGHLQYLARYKKYCRFKYNEEIHQERTEDQMITDLWEE